MIQGSESFSKRLRHPDDRLTCSAYFIKAIIPENQNAPFDMYEAIDQLIDEGSFFDIKKLFQHMTVQHQHDVSEE